MITNLTLETFDEFVGSSNIPVLIDYWAEWCGPCKMVAPVLDALAIEYEGKITIAKVNVDEEPALAAAAGIASIPTMRVYVDGQEVKSLVGAKPRAALVRDLAEYLG